MTQIEDMYVPKPLDPDKRASIAGFSKIERLVVQEEVKMGRSGAAVYFVDVEPRARDGPRGPHVLKVDRRPKGEDEQKKHEAAFQTAMGPFMPLLVETSASSNGWVASLYTLAHGTLVNARPLSHLLKTDIYLARGQVGEITEILTKWNPSASLSYEKPHQLLSKVLSHRLPEPEAISCIAADIFGIRPEDELLRFHGDAEVLPNPVAYLTSDTLWGQTRATAWPAGHTHGDLHCNNVICPLTARTSREPTIIDFSRYEPNGSTFLDLAYLEFSIILEIMPPTADGTREQWLVLDKALSRSVDLHVLPGGPAAIAVKDLLTPLRVMVSRSIEKFKRQDDFTAMFWLAGVAAGLNFFCELEDGFERKAALIFAAHRLQALLSGLGALPGIAKRIHELPWVQRILSAERLLQQRDTLAAGLVSPLQERRVILVLGPEFDRWLGLPSDKSLAESISRSKGRTPKLFIDQDDPAWFDSLLREERPESREPMKVAIAERLVLNGSQKEPIKGKIAPLSQVPWACLVDWSFWSEAQQLVQGLLRHTRRIVLVNINDEPTKIDLRDLSTCPWIFLRGVREESRTLVLGNLQWRLPEVAESRRKLLARLHSTGVDEMVAVFLGCYGEVLGKLYEELKSAFHNRLTVWVIGSSIEQDAKAKSLVEEGVHLVPLSPEEFCEFLHREFPEVGTMTETSERYVLEITGVEYVEGDVV